MNYHDNVLYTTTAQGCGGNPNQFYSYDLATKKVGSFNPGSGGMWPRLGPSIGKDGRVYAGSGDGDYFPEQQIFGQAIIATKQNPATKAMEMQDWFAPLNAFWLRKRDLDMNVTGPVFEYKGREYTVQSSKECRIWLLDTSALGGEDHRTPVHQTPLVCNEEVHFAGAGPWGALATWEDTDGTRWVLMPFWGPKHSKFTAPIEYGEVSYGAVSAFKVQTTAAGVRLVPAWLSRNMINADPVVVANGVVFAYGSGEDPTQASVDIGLAFNSAANRVGRSSHATLYALDGRTGAELWSSGDQIATFNHFTSMSVANGRVYIGTFDGNALLLRPGRARPAPGEREHASDDASSSNRDRARRRRNRAAGHGPRTGPRRRVDDQRWRRTAHRLGAHRPAADQRGRTGRAVQLPLEDEARQRVAPMALADRACPARSFDRLPGVQGAGLCRRQRRSAVLHGHRPGQAGTGRRM